MALNLMFLRELILKVSGLHPKHQTWFSKLYVLLYCCLSAMFMGLTIIKVALVYTDMEALSEVLEALTMFVHGTGKMMSIITKQESLGMLFDNKKYYWPLDKFGVKIEEKCNKMIRFTTKLTYLLVIMGFMVFIIYSLKMFFYEKIELPVQCYIPEGWPLSVLIPLQLFVDFNLVNNMLVADVLFISFCSEIIVQSKLVAHSFISIKYEDIETDEDHKRIVKQIGENVKLHNVLLRQWTCLSNFVTYSFFAQYAVCTLSTCFELFIILDGKDINLLVILRGIFYVYVISIELSVYCVGSELLYYNMANIGTSVWNSSWYKRIIPSIHNPIKLVIMKANRSKVFSAGGLIDINLKTFVTIFKTSFSCYTFMSSIRK